MSLLRKSNGYSLNTKNILQVQLINVVLKRSSKLASLYQLNISIDQSTNGASLEPGKLEIIWKSSVKQNQQENVSIIPLPKLEIPVEPLRIIAGNNF